MYHNQGSCLNVIWSLIFQVLVLLLGMLTAVRTVFALVIFKTVFVMNSVTTLMTAAVISLMFALLVRSYLLNMLQLTLLCACMLSPLVALQTFHIYCQNTFIY